MSDDATEGVTEYISRLQPPINLHAPVTTFMFSCSGTDVRPRRDEGSGKRPVQSIEPHRILAPNLLSECQYSMNVVEVPLLQERYSD